MVEKLEKLALSKRTAVVLTSDSAARHDGTEPDIFDRNGGLRTAGSEMYEGRLRVPLIVKWPAEVSPGSQTDFATTSWDMMATFTDMAGTVLPAGSTNGVSFVPALLGESKSRHGMLYWETRKGGLGQGVRIGDWKAVRPCGKMGIESVELYNVKEDPRDEEPGQGAPGDRGAVYQVLIALLAPYKMRAGWETCLTAMDRPCAIRHRSLRGFLL